MAIPTVPASIKTLLSAFPSHDSADPASAAMAYLYAVSGEPEAAVQEAVLRYIKGLVDRKDHRFAPSTADLAIEVRKCAESQKLREILANRPKLPPPEPDKPRVITPQEREAREKQVAELMQKLNGGKREPTKAAHEIEGEALTPVDISELAISPTLAKSALFTRT